MTVVAIAIAVVLMVAMVVRDLRLLRRLEAANKQLAQARRELAEAHERLRTFDHMAYRALPPSEDQGLPDTSRRPRSPLGMGILDAFLADPKRLRRQMREMKHRRLEVVVESRVEVRRKGSDG